MDVLKEIANTVEKRSGIPTYEKSIDKILEAILSTSDVWKIVSLSEEPLPLVTEAIKVLKEKNYVKIDNGIFLTEKGRQLIRELKLEKLEDFRCRCCGGKGLDFNRFKNLYEEFLEIQKNRPEPIREYDQGYITPISTIARVMFATSKGDVKNKDIIVLGDDDLVSIALALTRYPKRVVVLDIDERLINFIKNISNDYDLDIETIVFDLRKPLPEEYVSRFDTFITDPPETLPGFKAFVSKGLVTLKSERCAGYFGLTRIESSLNKWLEFQKFLLNSNVVITDILKDFSEYVNWGFVEETRAWDLIPYKKRPEDYWYKSYLFRIETLRNFKGENSYIRDEAFYQDVEGSCT